MKDEEGFRRRPAMRGDSDFAPTHGGGGAPGKRSRTDRLPAADPVTRMVHRLRDVESMLGVVGAQHLPAMRAAIDTRDMASARQAGAALATALDRIDQQLAAARQWATASGSAGALDMIAPLEAQRDVLRADAAPVLVQAPPPAPALPVTAAFDPLGFDFAEHDAAEAANASTWNAQLDAAEAPAPDNVVQLRGRAAADPAQVHDHAAAGVAGTGTLLPHQGAIQASFGAHDVTGIRAHVGGPAADASAAIGAEAYATGNDVAFASSPSLFVAAHEAAHVVQQRAGVSLLGGVGEAGDSYEQHADAVAEKVVRGESAEGLLGEVNVHPGAAALQRRETDTGVAIVDHGTGCENGTKSGEECVLTTDERDRLLIALSTVAVTAMTNYQTAIQNSRIELLLTTEGEWSFLAEFLFQAYAGPLLGAVAKGLAKAVGNAKSARAAVTVFDIFAGRTEAQVGLFTKALSEVPAESVTHLIESAAAGLKQSLSNAATHAGSGTKGKAAFLEIIQNQLGPATNELVLTAPSSLSDVELAALVASYRFGDHSVRAYQAIIEDLLDRYEAQHVSQSGEQIGPVHVGRGLVAEDDGLITPGYLEAYGQRRLVMFRDSEIDGLQLMSFVSDDLTSIALASFRAKQPHSPILVFNVSAESAPPFELSRKAKPTYAVWLSAAMAENPPPLTDVFGWDGDSFDEPDGPIDGIDTDMR